MRRLTPVRLTVLLTGFALLTGVHSMAAVPAQAAIYTVSVTASTKTVTVGGKVTFSGVVSPRPASRTIYLQSRYAGSAAWTTVKAFSAASTGNYTVTIGLDDDRDPHFRIYKPQSSTRTAGHSSAVQVVVNPVSKSNRATITSIAPGTVRLAGGTAVTIKGTNLAGATRVTVTPKVSSSYLENGVKSLPELETTFKVVDGQTLQVTPPASIGGTNVVKIYTPLPTVTANLRFARTARKASTFEKAILDQVNQRRTKKQTCNGKSMRAVGAITWDGELSDLALSHASDLAARQDVYKGLNHVTHGLKAFYHRFFAAGFTTGSDGEDLALSPAGYSATQVVAQWMSSKTGHCESVMGKKWAKAGVGVASGSWNGQASIFTNLDLRS